MRYIISVDIGGTNIRVALVDENGDIQSDIQRDSSRQSKSKITTKLYSMVNTTMKIYHKKKKLCDTLLGIGVSTGGIVHNGKIVSATDSIDSWENYDLLHVLDIMYTQPIKIDNDGNCALYAEQRWGVAQGYDNITMITIGTGVGIGIMAHGKIISMSEVHYTLEECISGKLLETNPEKLDDGLDKLVHYLLFIIHMMVPEVLIIAGPVGHAYWEKIRDKTVEKLSDFYKKRVFIREAIVEEQGLKGAATLFL